MSAQNVFLRETVAPTQLRNIIKSYKMHPKGDNETQKMSASTKVELDYKLSTTGM